MSWFVRILMTVLFVALLGGVSAYAVRRLYPTAWESWAKRAFLGGFVLLAIGVSTWMLGGEIDSVPIRIGGMTVSATMLVTSVALFVTLPVWLPLGAFARWRESQEPSPGAALEEALEETIDPSRRRFLRGFAGGVPVAAAAAGPVGTGAALATPILREVEIPVRDLPKGLDGLTILQLSDVHLGTYIGPDQVRAVLDQVTGEAAGKPKPDLIVLTGDISDDYSLLPEVLDAVGDVGAPLGAYACIGNHEIYRGRDEAIALYEKSPVKMLIDDGLVIEHNGDRLFICGSDDPARLGDDHRTFLEGAVGRALENCPDDVGCKVVLSHRPEGFEAAARRGATLTLSGHTHGGQVALLGRSVFEFFAPKSYLMGHYRSGDSHLFTSAGLGHWFPFRLGCPCEASYVTLRSA